MALLPDEQRNQLIASLSDEDAQELLYDWRFWARPSQLPPPGDWRVWLVRAGRGYGKTRIGAEWVRAQVESGACGRIALVAETAADARDVMVEGESGILSISPPCFKPEYEPSKRRLTWPNGAIATTYGAESPGQLRGPQHDGAWADELAKWGYEEAWDNLMFGLRLGSNPQCVATTTLKPKTWIKRIMEAPTTVLTGGSTYDNIDNLAPGFLSDIVSKYEGTRLGRQEIHGEYLDDVPGALWTRKMIEDLRVKQAPDFQRIVVAIDPAMTSGEDSDESGIIVAAKGVDGHGYIISDLTCRMSPDGWARRAVNAYHEHKADRIVAEVNNGGDLVERVIRTVDANASYKAVHASKGKRVRAEPIAALYEQCIAEGELISTHRGDIPIEEVTTGDYAWTRDGLKRILWAGQTGIKETIELRIGGNRIVCTNNHPILTNRGWLRAGHLVPNRDIVVLWDRQSTSAQIAGRWYPEGMLTVVPVRQLSDGERVSQSVNTLSSRVLDTIASLMVIIGRVGIEATNYCIERFINLVLGQSQNKLTYTTSTGIQAITELPTLLPSVQSNMAKLMSANYTRNLLEKGFRALNWHGGKIETQSSVYAKNVESSLVVKQLEFDSVRYPVIHTSTIESKNKSAHLPVYNLSVDQQPEYFVNGILVHNCKIHHIGMFAELEDQMCSFTPDGYDGSPDRVDAMVWALTELMLGANEWGW